MEVIAKNNRDYRKRTRRIMMTTLSFYRAYLCSARTLDSPDFFLSLTLLGACSTPPVQSDASREGFIHCESPRSEICTREYRPVCGHLDSQIQCVTQPCAAPTHKTYGNACSACADEAVVGYEFGSCESFGKGRL
ncbi:hypothetical protein [uncultured Spongiibacter sp.]|uniref:hypothetical protein n=1 Tax=uncultured Spongiibacter sp. TaxID=870896 RepID=UPI0025869240|nr:hypothetical protein [uncultured Spongiibacter sp.]